MIKQLASATILGVAILSLGSCSNDSFKKTKDGLEYRIITDKTEGKNPKDGDVVSLRLRIYYNEKDKKDTLLADYVKMNENKPIDIPVNIPLQFKGDWPAGIKLLTVGDSAIFRIPVDTIQKLSQQPMPEYMKKGSYILYSVVLSSIKSAADVEKEKQQMEQEQAAKAAGQMEIDDKLLQEYFAANNLKPTKTASGMYYITLKEGSGAPAQEGQAVTVNYTGKTLDGKTFDSNVDPEFKHTEPFSFVAGHREVIAGWDEAALMMKKGGKCKLFIPSPLAYGPNSPDPSKIPANSVLTFDVEVTGIKNADAPVAQ